MNATKTKKMSAAVNSPDQVRTAAKSIVARIMSTFDGPRQQTADNADPDGENRSNSQHL
jgi:hypothetical protein